MSILFQGKELVIDGSSIQMALPILDAVQYGEKIFVLFDPNSYLLDPEYKKMRKQGVQAIKNLIAINKAGIKLWEADFPESADYYYKITSTIPLVVNSFSSYRCEINIDTGKIKTMDFYK